MCTPDEQTMIYLAGLIDGEGTITISTQTNPKTGTVSGSMQIILANTYEPIIEWLRVSFGGSVYTQRSMSAKHKPIYVWRVTGATTMELCARMLPYLRIKRRQAEIVIEYAELRGYHNPDISGVYVPYEWHAQRAVLVDEIRSLNHRGTHV